MKLCLATLCYLLISSYGQTWIYPEASLHAGLVGRFSIACTLIVKCDSINKYMYVNILFRKRIEFNQSFLADCVTGDPRELTYELNRFRRDSGAIRLACTQQTRCGMHASIFLHTQMITRAGSLVYVQIKSGHKRGSEDISGLYRSFPAVFKWLSSGKG